MRRRHNIHYIENLKKVLLFFLVAIIIGGSFFIMNGYRKNLDLKIQCAAANTRIIKKIQNLESYKIEDNQTIYEVISLYKKASEKAEKNDADYALSELMADIMIKSYSLGFLDGKNNNEYQPF